MAASSIHPVVRKAIGVVTAIVAVAVIAHAWLVLKSRDAQDIRKLASLLRQGTALLQEGPAPTAEPAAREAQTTQAAQFHDWAWALLGDDDVISASLTDARGRILDVIPPGAPTAGSPADSPSTSLGSIAVIVQGKRRSYWRGESALTPGTSADAPIRLVLLGRRRPWLGAEASRLGGFAGVVAGFGAVGLALFARWYDRRMRRPLAVLGSLEGLLAAPTSPAPPDGRSDEVAAAARSVEGLLIRLRLAETEVDRLEQSIHSRVADQTRQINAQLRRAERAAWVDPLTGLGNRRLLDDRLQQLFLDQREQGGDLCVVMMDLDRFKQLNDTRGHAAGDELLRFAGELLKGALRPSDLGVRYGGDEFALILPDTGPEQAAQTAERIARLFQQRCSVIDLDPPPGLSAGIASLRRDRPESGQRLLELADQALYAAKARGREALCARG